MTHRLDLLPMWNDELFTVRAAQQTVGAMLEMVRGDVHPPLYFLLAHYWIRIFPDGFKSCPAMFWFSCDGCRWCSRCWPPSRWTACG